MVDGSFTILVVCQGNIHRSALAAALLQTWTGWYLPADVATHVLISSAGLGAPEGAPMEAPVRDIAASLGADGSTHRARQIDDGLVAAADLVLTASRRQRDDVLRRVPGALRGAFTIREAGRIAADLGSQPSLTPASIETLHRSVGELSSRRTAAVDEGEDDITDPQGRGAEAFRRMAREEVPALARVGAFLFGMPRPDLEAYIAAADDLYPMSAER